MLNNLIADLLVLLHFGFILFVVFGGLLVLRWKWFAWFHLPAVAWGALIEFAGWVCPLTPLENRVRNAAGGSEYSGSFIEHYLMPVIYPAGLTRDTQIALGIGVIAINLIIYTLVIKQGKTV